MRWLVFMCLGVLSLAASAKTVEGVDLRDEVSVGETPLVLNGAGVREKFFFDIYVAALYLPQKMSDASRILGTDQPWRVTMDFLYSEVSKEKLDKGWDEGFEANVPADRLPALKERLQKFKSMFTAMRKGDRVFMDYLPGRGVYVNVKGEEKGVIPGADFARALLSVWLGEDPVTSSVKKALLGN